MSECTHNCSSCSGEACQGGCHIELPEGEKPRDILKELKQFYDECEGEEVLEMFSKMMEEMEEELA